MAQRSWPVACPHHLVLSDEGRSGATFLANPPYLIDGSSLAIKAAAALFAAIDRIQPPFLRNTFELYRATFAKAV